MKKQKKTLTLKKFSIATLNMNSVRGGGLSIINTCREITDGITCGETCNETCGESCNSPTCNTETYPVSHAENACSGTCLNNNTGFSG